MSLKSIINTRHFSISWECLSKANFVKLSNIWSGTKYLAFLLHLWIFKIVTKFASVIALRLFRRHFSRYSLHMFWLFLAAYMVRRAVSARMEDYVRGDAKFLGGVDAGDHPADHGGDGLPLPQYPHIQPKATGRSLREGWSADRVIESLRIPAANRIEFAYTYNRSIARLFPPFAIEISKHTNASRHVQY